MDRGKHGLKRSVLVDGTGVPLDVVAAGANRHDSPLLNETLAGLDRWGADPAAMTVHLDRGYDSGVTRALLDELGFEGEIARKGLPEPVQAGKRWVVERTHASDERLWQAAPLDREGQGDGRAVLVSGGDRRGRALTDPAGTQPLPLARPTHRPALEVTSIAGRF